MGYFTWKPNFFIVLVAPPGIVNKSTTSGVGMDLLRQVPGVNFGPDSVTWQALTQSFSQKTEMVDMGTGELFPMSCLTIAASELGTFLDMRNREMIDVLVDLWDGRNVPWTKRTKMDGEEVIPNPWINIIAGTTPAWIRENIPEYAIGGGFTSRTVFVYADSKYQLVAYPGNHIPVEFKDQRKLLIEDLIHISKMRGRFQITKEAYALGEKWYNDHWIETPDHLKGDRIAGYSARKQTHMHKIAMILSAAQRDDMLIQPEDFEKALTMLGTIEENMTKVFDTITDRDDVKDLGVFLTVLNRIGATTKQHLYCELSTRMGHESFEACCIAAVFAGKMEMRQLGSKLMVYPLRGAVLQSPGIVAGTSALPEVPSPAAGGT
jgi:hypothetical protein